MVYLAYEKKQKPVVDSLIKRYRLPRRGFRYWLKKDKTNPRNKFRIMLVSPIGDVLQWKPLVIAGRKMQENR